MIGIGLAPEESSWQDVPSSLVSPRLTLSLRICRSITPFCTPPYPFFPPPLFPRPFSPPLLPFVLAGIRAIPLLNVQLRLISVPPKPGPRDPQQSKVFTLCNDLSFPLFSLSFTLRGTAYPSLSDPRSAVPLPGAGSLSAVPSTRSQSPPWYHVPGANRLLDSSPAAPARQTSHRSYPRAPPARYATSSTSC